MSNQGYYGNQQPQYPQQSYGPPQGNYGPPQPQMMYPPQGQYQQAPPPKQKKDRGCLAACHSLQSPATSPFEPQEYKSYPHLLSTSTTLNRASFNMSATPHREPSSSSSNNKMLDQHSGAVNKPKKCSNSTLTLKNGLLRTDVSARSELLQIAKRNSTESPLLRLPPELRNLIWEHVLGHHDIMINSGTWSSSRSEWLWSVQCTRSPLSKTGHRCWEMIEHTFELPLVCRQTYVEASPMIYTLNRFEFYQTRTFDHFIRNRVLGQRCLISCVTVPVGYFQHYLQHRRRPFCSKFPNIERIRVKYLAANLEIVVRRLFERPVEFEDHGLKSWIEDYVKHRECRHLEIEWY
ncbi:hypothetical protein yc1106_04603 [Curvularia clavata]|uniref:DUF7730 domain-containing protein n=1 Tax=Curvularia clavata TaxID=95742 RepID=A0A9Q8Z9G1_CURCL|nr:hypothetical protein yc1106_04603 [Curvularia clavata]